MTRGMKSFLGQKKSKQPVVEVNKTKLIATLVGLAVGATVAIYLVSTLA